MIAIILLIVLGGSVSHLSRDSAQYHRHGLELAEQYASGDIDWSRWIDEGWRQFVGMVYYLVWPDLTLITIWNVLLCGVSGMLLYRITMLVFEHRGVAYVSALAFVWFPSAVYYTVCPLKEATSIFALLCIVYGTCVLVARRRLPAWPWIVLGLLIIASLRVYLVPVCICCVTVSVMPVRLAGGMRGTIQLLLVVGIMSAAAFVVLSTTEISLTNSMYFEYFDVDRINQVRGSLGTRGRAAMFDTAQEAQFGQGIVNDIWLAVYGLVIFFFSINPFDVTRTRQWAAVPEMTFFALCIPCLWVGVRDAWRRMPNRVLPIILFGLALIAVYGSTATNAGAMYRWRLQALPFLLTIVVYGALVRRRGIVYALLRPLGLHSWQATSAGQRRQINTRYDTRISTRAEANS